MGKIRVHRKGYRRRGYRRKDGTYVKPCYVPPSTFYQKDRGKRGRTPKKERWFKPKSTLGGWSKNQKASTRRRKALASTPKNWSLRRRYRTAGRKLQALANVTVDSKTKKRAKADANYFFRKL